MDKLNKAGIIVSKKIFSIVRARQSVPDAFAVIQDKNEITVIIESKKVNKKNIIKIEPGWKVLTFDQVLPFNEIGFIAKISNALAEEKISIFVISSFSTDHIFIKEKDLTKAIQVMKQLGYSIKTG